MTSPPPRWSGTPSHANRIQYPRLDKAHFTGSIPDWPRRRRRGRFVENRALDFRESVLGAAALPVSGLVVCVTLSRLAVPGVSIYPGYDVDCRRFEPLSHEQLTKLGK